MNRSPSRSIARGIVIILAIGMIAILLFAVRSHRRVSDQTVNTIARKDA